MSALNYRHLHYFWVVAQEGSMTRAAERLGVAIQTVSAQVAQLEQALGKALLHAQGRALVLTEAGRIALAHADQIFQLGDNLRTALDDTGGQVRQRVRVGISDGIPKRLAHRLLATGLPSGTRLVCDDDEFDDLLADLALNRLDLVLTDRPAASQGNLRLISHRLYDFPMAWYGSASLVPLYRENWPQCLAGAPVLLPTRHHLLRPRIEEWLDDQGVRVDIVAEFEDDGLLNTFARSGLGLFAAPAVLAPVLADQDDIVLLGLLAGVSEQVYAITSERKLPNPAVEAWLAVLAAEPLNVLF